MKSTPMIAKAEIVRLVLAHPGITTPELAEKLDIGIGFARFCVLETEDVEFYDGNHIRVKEAQK